MRYLKNSQGFSLIELLVAIAFIGIATTLILKVNNSNNLLRKVNEEKTKALFYATASMELVEFIDWEDLVAGDYHPVLESNTWSLVAGSELLDNFYTRKITVSNVYRSDSSQGNVHGTLGGSFLDPDSKKITVTLDWLSKSGVNQQTKLEKYLYRWQANRFTQTDWVGGAGQVDWSDQTKFFSKDAGSDVTIPGIITLNSGFLDWNKAVTTSTVDTPGTSDNNDVYELDGYAYLVTENNSSGSEFYILDVSDIAHPSQLSSLDIGSAVNSVVVKDNYAYLATDHDTKELVIVNVTDKNNPVVSVNYDFSSSSTNAEDVVVNDNQIYLARGTRLYAFNKNNPNQPQLLGNINLGANVLQIFLSGNYVYAATENSNNELQIIDITNPATLAAAGQYNLSGSLRGTDIFVRGTRAYISTQANSSGPEFFVFDISDPADPTLIGSYEAGNTIDSLAIVGPYALIGLHSSTEELRVLDVSFPATINKISGFNLPGYVLGMSANCSVIYAATSGDAGEFSIISTEDFDCGYASAGILESSTFDTGATQLAYNWIAWSGSQPQNTSIRFQLATSNNLAGPWSFVGPDGTSNTYYTNSASELINYNHHLNQRYFRYKLFLATQAQLQVPLLEELTISYSPY